MIKPIPILLLLFIGNESSHAGLLSQLKISKDLEPKIIYVSLANEKNTSDILNREELQKLRDRGEEGEAELFKYYQLGLVYSDDDIASDLPLIMKRADAGNQAAQAAYIVLYAIVTKVQVTFYDKSSDQSITQSRAMVQKYWRALKPSLKNNKFCGFSNFLLGLGTAIEHGYGEKCIPFFERARDLGFELARLWIAHVQGMAEKSYSTKVDDLFAEAASTGNLWAGFYYYGYREKYGKDYSSIMKKLIEQEFPFACSTAGRLFIDSHEANKGIPLLLSAASYGDLGGNYCLGKFLVEHPNSEMAGMLQSPDVYLLKNAQRGHSTSMYVLGIYFAANNRQREGIKWFNAASNLKHDLSTRWLAVDYLNKKDFLTAYKYYLHITNKSADDFYRLALFHKDKLIDNHQNDLMIKYMVKAAKLGHKDACLYGIFHKRGYLSGW